MHKSCFETFYKKLLLKQNSNKFQKVVSIFLKYVCGLFLGCNIEIWSRGAKLNVLT